MATTLRKSTRLSKDLNSEEKQKPEQKSSQLRITEFVNVKKRVSGLVDQLPQKVIEKDTGDKEAVASACSTPVKIKRKSVVIEGVKKMGVLTPSPSVESISEKATEVEDEDSVIVVANDVVVDTPLELDPIDEAPSLTTSRTSVTPAYKRFAHLVENVRSQKPKLEAEVPAPETVKCEPQIDNISSDFKYVPWLPIGEKWAIYEKIIFNVDNLCVLAAGRSQPCIFHKIQKTLENVLGRQVPIDQMERLKTLWPEAYEYREAKCVMQGKRVDSVAVSVPGLAGSGNSAALLNERKEQVRGRMQKYLIQEHNKKFANENDSFIVPKQWHEKFDQSTVAEIARSKLIEGNEEAVTLPPIPKMIDEIISNTASPRKQQPVISDNIASLPSTPLKLETVSSAPMSLIERIRAKEQKLQASKCFGSGVDPESARLQAILSQMDRFTQSVMFTFSSAKKTSLFLTDLTQKLVQSSKVALSGAEVVERLKMLERAAPDWIKIVDEEEEIGNSAPKHVKILDKSRSLSSILESLQRMRS